MAPTTCSKDPQSTNDLIGVIQSLKVPVVVGESTDVLPTQVGGSCLVRKPQLDFSPAKVRHGITRLNPDKERVPLQWSVASSDSAQSGSTNSATADGGLARMDRCRGV